MTKIKFATEDEALEYAISGEVVKFDPLEDVFYLVRDPVYSTEEARDYSVTTRGKSRKSGTSISTAERKSSLVRILAKNGYVGELYLIYDEVTGKYLGGRTGTTVDTKEARGYFSLPYAAEVMNKAEARGYSSGGLSILRFRMNNSGKLSLLSVEA